MAATDNIDTMDWGRAAEISDYLRRVLADRYNKVAPADELQEFLDKRYGVDAIKQKLRDDRYRILVLDRGDNLCGVALMHWSSEQVILEMVYKPQRKQTLAALTGRAIEIAGVWGFSRIACNLFPEEEKLIRDLQDQGFEETTRKVRDPALAEHPQIEWIRTFDPIGAITTL